MSFNKASITGLLREKYHYDGVVCTDWGLIIDFHMPDAVWPARAWGVEHLSAAQRVRRSLEAGVDQFGGESCPEHVIDLVKTGRLSEARLDQSVQQLLRLKFQLGLFDNPFWTNPGFRSRRKTQWPSAFITATWISKKRRKPKFYHYQRREEDNIIARFDTSALSPR